MKKNLCLVLLALLTNVYADNKTVRTVADSVSGPKTSSETLVDQGTEAFVRCYYRVSEDDRYPGTKYVFAKSNGNYYNLPGSWYGTFTFGNMFYTRVSQKEIEQICNDTLDASAELKGKKSISQFAANNKSSLNRMIWSMEKNSINKVDRVVSFGDSLSDTNNMYNLSNWILPNANSWFQGRFSNGNTWPEYLARLLQLPQYNWAIGGAAGDTKFLAISGLKSQVISWANYMKYDKTYSENTSENLRQLSKHTLFTIMIGGNDIINYNLEVGAILNNLNETLKILTKNGAENILVLNLPDLTVAPLFKYKSPQEAEKVRNKVNELNRGLQVLVNLYNTGQIKVHLYKTEILFNKIMNNRGEYSIDNITDSCLKIDSNPKVPPYLSKQTVRESCQRASEFIFWDTLHPTTSVHKILANDINKTIPDLVK